MRALSLIAAGAAALLASLSCAAMPLPESKAAYAGEWIGKDMRLRMDPDGKVAYRRVGRDVNIDVTIELVAFDGDNFSAGVGPLSWTFVVSRPPHAEGSALRMVVDGVELTKSPSSRTQGNDQ